MIQNQDPVADDRKKKEFLTSSLTEGKKHRKNPSVHFNYLKHLPVLLSLIIFKNQGGTN